jgi:hypothetical protein
MYSYLLGQVPSNMILNRVRPSWFMSGQFKRQPHKTEMTIADFYPRLYACLVRRQSIDLHGTRLP